MNSETRVVQLGEAGAVTVIVEVEWLKLPAEMMARLRKCIDDLADVAAEPQPSPYYPGTWDLIANGLTAGTLMDVVSEVPFAAAVDQTPPVRLPVIPDPPRDKVIPQQISDAELARRKAQADKDRKNPPHSDKPLVLRCTACGATYGGDTISLRELDRHVRDVHDRELLRTERTPVPNPAKTAS